MGLTTKCIGNFMIVIGLAGAVFSIAWLIIRVILDLKFLPVSAEIVGIKKGETKVSSKMPIPTETPILRYTVDGREYETACLPPVIENTGGYVIGQRIDIVYHPAKPEKHFAANRFRARHFGALSGIGLSVFFIAIGIYFRTLTI